MRLNERETVSKPRSKIKERLTALLFALGLILFAAFMAASINGCFDSRENVIAAERVGSEYVLISIEKRYHPIWDKLEWNQTYQYIVSQKLERVWQKIGTETEPALAPVDQKRGTKITLLMKEFLDRQEALTQLKHWLESQTHSDPIPAPETETPSGTAGIEKED